MIRRCLPIWPTPVPPVTHWPGQDLVAEDVIDKIAVCSDNDLASREPMCLVFQSIEELRTMYRSFENRPQLYSFLTMSPPLTIGPVVLLFMQIPVWMRQYVGLVERVIRAKADRPGSNCALLGSISMAVASCCRSLNNHCGEVNVRPTTAQQIYSGL
jgi:hypothetical protein